MPRHPQAQRGQWLSRKTMAPQKDLSISQQVGQWENHREDFRGKTASLISWWPTQELASRHFLFLKETHCGCMHSSTLGAPVFTPTQLTSWV